MMHRLAIAILNFNGRHYLEKFLPGVLSHNEGYPVYVIDNGSSDDSIQFLRLNFPAVLLITLDKNEGFAGGYNLGLRQIESQFYLLLNSDIEVGPGWLSPLVDFMIAHTDCFACQPKILYYNERNKFEYAGAAGGYVDRLGYPFCRGRIFNNMEYDEGQYNDTREIFWASGACMLVRSSAFWEAGGFDADFFAHMEEVDLCWRLKKGGWKVFYVAESSVNHIGGGTLSARDPKKTYLNFRNNLLMLIKNLDGSEMFRVIPARILLDIMASLKFLVLDSSGDCFAVLKAMWKSYSRFNKEWRKRKSIPAKFKNGELSGVYRKSIIWEYYFKGVRKFSQLEG